jgi:hypothetical protein
VLLEGIKNETLKFEKDIYSVYNDTNPSNSTQSSVVTATSKLPPPLSNPGLCLDYYLSS